MNKYIIPILFCLFMIFSGCGKNSSQLESAAEKEPSKMMQVPVKPLKKPESSPISVDIDRDITFREILDCGLHPSKIDLNEYCKGENIAIKKLTGILGFKISDLRAAKSQSTGSDTRYVKFRNATLFLEIQNKPSTDTTVISPDSLCTATAVLPYIIRKPAPGHPGVMLDFMHDLQLTSEEIDSVISLAEKCGIKDISRIETYHTEPINYPGIYVYEKEILNGRKVTYRKLGISNKSWEPENVKPKKDAIIDGNFWTYKDKSIISRKAFILKANGKEYRVRSIGKYSIEDADRILEMFINGKYTIADQDTLDKLGRGATKERILEELKYPDFTNPESIRPRMAAFSLKDSSPRSLWESCVIYSTDENGIIIFDISRGGP